MRSWIVLNESTAARRRIYFQLVDVTDGITPETGEGSGQPQISTNGGAWTNTGIGTLTHIGNGRYYADLTQAAVNGTAGDIIETRYKSANTAEAVGDSIVVVAVDPFSTDFGTLDVNAAQISGSATAANNAELFFDGTGYAGGTTKLQVDAVAISGDTTAADNLESQYDTTGLSGDTFPATQSQLTGISSSGAAVNQSASSYTLTLGTQSANTYTATGPLDGTNHEHTDDIGSMDLYYEFVITGTPTSVTMTGYLNSSNDSLEVYAYDWIAAGWTRIGTLTGKNLTSNDVHIYNLFTSHVGTGGDLGKVRIRFTDGAFTLTSATLAIDQIFVSYSPSAGGYEDGAVWFDSNVSNTNTVVGIDGTSTNPVSTSAALLTLLSSTNLTKARIANRSWLSLTGAFNNKTMMGEDWDFDPNAQSISGSVFIGASIQGSTSTAASPPSFVHCVFDNAVTLPPHREDCCHWGSTITFSAAGDYYFNDVRSRIPGAAAPTINLASNGSTNVSVRNYSGGLNVSGIAATDVLSIGGPDLGTVTLTGADGTVDMRGTGKPVVDSRTGSPTLTVTGYVEDMIDLVPAAVDTTLTAAHGSGSWSASGLTGARSLTIHTQEADTTTIASTQITVRDEADTTTLTVINCDLNGDAPLSIDDGTYQLHLVRAGYSFVTTELVVTGDATVNVTGTAISTGSPTSPDGCMVYGTLMAGTSAHASVTVKMHELVSSPQVEDGNLMSGLLKTTTTDANGYFEIEMAAGTKIVVDIPEAGILHVITLPDDTTYDISEEWD